MNLQKQLQRFRNYARQQANSWERLWVEKYFDERLNEHETSTGRQVLLNEEELKQELLNAIRARIKEPKKRTLIGWRIAASLVLLVASVVVLTVKISPQPEPISWIKYVTAAGQRQRITLPDSSHVWLNANSAIAFPKKFSEHERTVSLKGEAFFQVTRLAHKPFIVQTPTVTTHVLGTSFNVNAYPNQHPTVSVREGKVRVTSANNTVELIRNEQATLTNNMLSKTNMDAERYDAWTNGVLLMENSRVEDVLNTLSNWYNVTFTYQDDRLKECRINGKLKIDTLDNLLQSFSYLMKVSYTRKADNNIYITGNMCNP